MNTPVFKDIKTQILATQALTFRLRIENLRAKIDNAVLMGKMSPERAAELLKALR